MRLIRTVNVFKYIKFTQVNQHKLYLSISYFHAILKHFIPLYLALMYMLSSYN